MAAVRERGPALGEQRAVVAALLADRAVGAGQPPLLVRRSSGRSRRSAPSSAAGRRPSGTPRPSAATSARGWRSACRARSSRRGPSSPGVRRHCGPSRLILKDGGYESPTMNRCILGVLIVALAFPSAASAQTVYSSLPLSGRRARPDAGGQRRRAAGAARGRVAGPARDAQRRHPARRRLDARARGGQRARARRGTTPRSPTSARSTRARAMISLPILNEVGIPQISPSNTYNGLTIPERAGRAGQVLPDRRPHLLPPAAQRHRPGRRARDRDARPRLHAGRRRVRQRGLRPRHEPRPQRGGRARLGVPIVVNRRISRRHAPVPRDHARQAGLRRLHRASPPTAPSRLFRAVGRGQASCSRPTASPSPASRAACRPRSRARTIVTVATLAPDAYPGASDHRPLATRTRSTATRR